MSNDILSNVWPEWHVVKRIGSGSYGVVYEIERTDHSVTSRAAVKVISIPESDAEMDSLHAEGITPDDSRTYLEAVVKDFVSEIQLMESFKGIQNIVSVEDYKVVEKKDRVGWDIYIRMELLTPFSQYISDKTLTEKEVIKLGTDLCTALEFCGRKNVIHRDIKPQNIFINEFGSYKLGDFGIARKLENINGGLSQKGSPNYMAPEVAKSTKYDATIDQYSLGLVLYQLLNKNRLPFLDTERQLLSPGERRSALDRRLNGEKLPPPCDASPALAEVILKACAPDPATRFASPSEFKEALLQAAEADVNADADVDEPDPFRKVTVKSNYSQPEGDVSPELEQMAAAMPEETPVPETPSVPEPQYAEPLVRESTVRKSRRQVIAAIFAVIFALILIAAVLTLAAPDWVSDLTGIDINSLP